jgi:phage antirepressor YoqD-like protein
VIVVNGGNSSGTWMQEDVAMEFARWLSPKFAIWCNDRIKEVLKYGFTATDTKLEELISNPDLIIGLATELKNERAAKLLAQSQVKELKPKAEIADMINSAQNNLTMNEASKILGVTRNLFMRELRECKVLMSNNTPYQKYLNSGYFAVKVTPIKKGAYEFNTPKTYVTAKGLTWLAETMK